MNPSTRRALSWGIPALVALAITALLMLGADGPADPTFRIGPGPVEMSAPARSRVADFREISFRVDATGVPFGNGASLTGVRCALLAASADQHNRGLMGQTDLSGYDGMLFRFDTDTESTFYMKNTLIPLSIAWFDAEGRFVSTADMEPCGDAPVCPTYGPEKPYRYALEVAQGGLPALGIGPGARLLIGEEKC
ncbi:MAG TPA: DUF192 domain-containing protein [Acidimicrobiales bacterium]|nr:DUF192 domain-containing protein [Acidimicrobiales bacterium]